MITIVINKCLPSIRPIIFVTTPLLCNIGVCVSDIYDFGGEGERKKREKEREKRKVVRWGKDYCIQHFAVFLINRFFLFLLLVGGVFFHGFHGSNPGKGGMTEVCVSAYHFYRRHYIQKYKRCFCERVKRKKMLRQIQPIKTGGLSHYFKMHVVFLGNCRVM